MSWLITGAPGTGDNLLYSQAGTPTLDLRFASTKSLTDYVSGNNLITFTRASTGTFVDSNGLIQTAAINAPRFDHNPTTGESLGLLVEEARTNFITDSASANNWTLLAGGTTAASSSICPDGTTNGTRVTAVALNDGAYKVFSITTGGNYIGTYYARTRTGVAVDVKAAISGTNGPTVTLPADGAWVRVAGSLSNLGAGSKYLSVRSANASMDIDVWGLQAELGAFPTSYIPTTTSTVTRAADAASITGTNFSSWYNQSQGSIFASVRTVTPASVSNGLLRLTDGTSSNRIEIQQSGSGDAFPRVTGLFRYLNSTTASFTQQETGWNTNGVTVDNWALGYNSSGFTIQTKFDATPSTGSGTVPQNLTNFSIGHKGTIARLAYYPVRLPDTTLQAITQ